MPRIQLTPTVRVALIFLRIYLIVLLLLILFKFILLFTHGSSDNQKGPHERPPTGHVLRLPEGSGGRLSARS